MLRWRRFFQIHKTLILSVGFLVIFSFTVAHAVPPSTQYNAGETLDPQCVPGSNNCTVAGNGSSQWDDVAGGINYAGGNVGVENGAITIGSNIANDWGDPAGTSLLAIHDVSTGDDENNQLFVASTADSSFDQYGVFKTLGNLSQWQTVQLSQDGSQNTGFLLSTTPTDVLLELTNESGDPLTQLNPTAEDTGNTPYYFNTSLAHTAGNIFEVDEQSSPLLTLDYAGNLFVTGNITCGGSCGGGGGPIEIQTNGSDNGSQSFLNLIAGTNMTLTEDGNGNVTLDAGGGGGGGSSQWDDIGNGINYDNGFVGIGTGGADALAELDLEGDGSIVAVGTISSGIPVPDLGAGTRMMWIPSSAAFRAGTLDDSDDTRTLWDSANVGQYSVAFGVDTEASGNASTAFGLGSSAQGAFSTAFGNGGIAAGQLATVFGSANNASGNASTAFGASTSAGGDFSTTFGVATRSDSYSSMAIGRYNVGGGDPASWVDTDPIFEIGNGADSGNLHDAFKVLKNGNTVINGDLTVNGNIFCTGGTCQAGSGGTGGTTLFETDGAANGSQTLFNLVSSGRITVTDDGSGNITFAGGSQWDDVSGGINYAGGLVGIGNANPTAALDVISNAPDDDSSVAVNIDTANTLTQARALLLSLSNAGTRQFAVRKNGDISIGADATEPNGPLGYALTAVRDTGLGEDGDNGIELASVNNGAFDRQSRWDTTGSPTSWDTNQYAQDGSLITQVGISTSPTDVFIKLSNDQNANLTFINPTADDGDVPYLFNTSIDHTSGDLFDVKNLGTNMLTLDNDGNLFAAGNITCGGSCGSQWANIAGGISYGGNVTISGNIAAGGGTASSGAFAFGSGASATGDNSFAFGNGATTTDDNSFAAGFHNTAGDDAVAIGFSNTASGLDSVAIGDSNTTTGLDDSFAFGYGNIADGLDTMALGFGLHVTAIREVAVGSGNIGGGDTNHVWVATDPIFEVGNSNTGTPSDALMILKNGMTGIALDPANPHPTYLLQVGSSAAASGVVARFQNTSGTCDINPTTASLVCTSDMTLKKNITNIADNSPWSFNNNISIQNQSVLSNVLALNPVDYNWKTENDGTQKHPGFIAQEVQEVFPELVSTDPSTHLLSLNYTGLIPYTVGAIKEMNVNITSIDDLTKQNTWRDALLAWFADTNNGIKNMFSDTVKTNNLCVGTVCVTQQQFLQMVNNSGSTSSSAPANNNSNNSSDQSTDTQSTVVPDPVITSPAEQSPQTQSPDVAPVVPDTTDSSN